MAEERTIAVTMDQPGGDGDVLDDADLAADWLSEGGRIYRLLVREFGAEMADAFALARATQERWASRRHPHDGLRERKKRRTRQQISDVATVLFLVRGFDHVKVSEVAEIVGVSEKTVYNYFPTKESLVFDRTDEDIAHLVSALRNREPGESPAKAVLRALGEELEELVELPEAIEVMLPLFDEMIAETPSLRAAWLDLQGRLVEVATEELAALADVDPRDPEPIIAARAIAGLYELAPASRIRHMEQGLRGRALADAVLADLQRAVRLLDTGLWSFNLLTQGTRAAQQLRDAALAAEDTRKQVLSALKQARATWRQLHRSGQREGKRAEGELKRAIKQGAHEARAAAKSAAYEALRQKLDERHEEIRDRHAALRKAAPTKP